MDQVDLNVNISNLEGQDFKESDAIVQSGLSSNNYDKKGSASNLQSLNSLT